MDINDAKLTAEEQNHATFHHPDGKRVLEGASWDSEATQRIADAATAKALGWVANWLEWMEGNAPMNRKDLYAYGGPGFCEYCCLPGTAQILREDLESAGIPKPGVEVGM